MQGCRQHAARARRAMPTLAKSSRARLPVTSAKQRGGPSTRLGEVRWRQEAALTLNEHGIAFVDDLNGLDAELYAFIAGLHRARRDACL